VSTEPGGSRVRLLLTMRLRPRDASCAFACASRRSRPALFAALLLALAWPPADALAQPVLDQFVSNADLVPSGNCSLLRIVFHVRMRYVGHFPLDHGDQLEVTLHLVDGPRVGVGPRLYPREGIRLENAAAAGIQSLFLALDEADGPVLHVLFLHPAAYQVVQSGSFEEFAMVIANKGSAAACKIPGFATSVRDAPGRTGKLTDADVKVIEASMDEARAALRKGNFAGAAALLRKVLKYPENRASAEAQELLGVALQKSGQSDEARAEFEDYLRRYPIGDGSERVRQRLAGMLTAGGAAPGKLAGGLGVQPTAAELKKLGPTGETRWTMSGSASIFYVTDDSASTAKDISTAINPNADPDAHREHQNSILTNYDMFGTSDNDQVRTKFKLAMTDEYDVATRTNQFGVSTALLEYTIKDYGLTTIIGRQSRNTGGVLGRFDGAVVSWQESPAVRFNVLAGSPNWSRFDAPFLNDKTEYGASVDFLKVFGVLDTTLYTIAQFDRSFVDREAIGAEFRYFNSHVSALGQIDYDVHFNELNAAIFSGTYTMDDKSVINTALDYRKVPFLSSWTALQGQPFLTLYDMMKFNTADDIRQFAIDRTPTFESAMVSYTHPLNATYQIGGDATVTNLTGTVPSGGVDGTLASGLEYYLSAQLTGSGIFRPGDILMAAFRYASLSDSKDYVIDFNTRFPITPTLSVSPRLRVGYRTGVGTDLKETTILPSFLVNYLWSKDLSFEAEIGYKYMNSTLVGVKTVTNDLYATVGVRKDFGIDGLTQCHGAAVSCAWAQPAIMRSTGQGGDAGLPVKAPEPGLPFYAFEGGVRYWFSSGKNGYTYYADPTPSNQVSRLTYSGLTAHSGEAYFRFDGLDGPLANVFLKGYIGGGKIVGGKLYDEDFPPFVDPYSKTSSDTSGQLQYAIIDLGYNVFQIDPLRFGAFVGFHYWQETVDARGCTQIGGNPFICTPALPSNLKVITEQDRRDTGRAGLSAEAFLWRGLSWQGEIAYAWVSQHAIDNHYLTFGLDPASGNGSGFEAETILKYRFGNGLALGVGGRWWHFSTKSVDLFDQLLRYTTDRYGVFVQGSYQFH
jgi:tetratricopeptide (TPR) repeat protein